MPVAGLEVFALAIPFIKSSTDLDQYFDTYPLLIYGTVAGEELSHGALGEDGLVKDDFTDIAI